MRRSFLVVALTLAIAATAFSAPASATPGELDHFFNNTGKNSTFVAGGTGYAVAIDHHGRTLVAGYTQGAHTDIAIARFLPDGKLDNTFNGDGRVTTSLGGLSYAFDVAVQSDGKIVVAGERDLANSSSFAIVRYTMHGALDTTFGSGGRVLVGFGRRYQGANAIGIGIAGNIVVGGFASDGTASQWAMVRLLPNGAKDTTFGSGGKVLSDFSATNEQMESLIVGAGGTITAGGFAEVDLAPRFTIAQYNVRGRLITTFAHHGRNLIDVSKGADIAYGLARQPDGKFLLVGSADNAGQLDWGLARVGPHGLLDPGFGGDGTVVTHFTAGNDYAYGTAVQPNGRIIVVGRGNGPNGADFCVVRYLVNGTLDTTFGTGGKVFTDFDHGQDTARGVALQTNGKIVVGGEAQFGGVRRLAAARYLPS